MHNKDTMPVQDALTFDDVCLVPCYSEVLPSQVDTSIDLGRGIRLKSPILSAAMDTVTEAKTAIAMAQCGGMGIIHKNLSPEEQALQVRQVKKYEAGIVSEPITVSSDHTVQDLKTLMREHGVSGFPVVIEGKLVGIVTRRDLQFAANTAMPVAHIMTKDVVSLPEGVSAETCLSVMQERRIEKLPLVDSQGYLVGLVTMRDLKHSDSFPHVVHDVKGRLLCGAAIGVGNDLKERAALLVEAGVDMLVVDTAHGNSLGVVRAIRWLRETYPHMTLCAGNIVTADAVETLAAAGVDVVKVGVGPGSICTTRIVAGVGVPQLSAVWEVSKAARKLGICVIADGGIKYSGDIVKALAAGAHAVMVGSLLAGTDEAPGERILYQGRAFKVYRGMGSLDAMAKGSKDRYGQMDVEGTDKLVPEGIEGRIPYRGPLKDVVVQLVGGLRSGMGYLGAPTLEALHHNARFVKLTPSGLRESHVHDVVITKESPNYHAQGGII